MKDIKLSNLRPHPKNPRLAPREDVVNQIAAQITAAGEFDKAHALIVREIDGAHEIISGHHRMLAAQKAGLDSVPCWVRKMSNEDAYMALALNNAQSELSSLERGLHAYHSDMGVREYARAVGISPTWVTFQRQAAEVFTQVNTDADLGEKTKHLSEIYDAPRWLWASLVSHLISDSWTVEAARKQTQRFKDIVEPPEWADAESIAEAVADGTLKISDVKQFAAIVEKTENVLTKGEDDAERLIEDLHKTLVKKRPSLISEVVSVCQGLEQEQAELIRQRQQADLLRTKRDEEIAARTARLRRNVSLDEWKELAKDEQEALLGSPPDGEDPGSFIKQNTDAIEWAQWSWNPVTGCLHTCPYCYARDIAESARMAKTKAYPHGFAPAFRPATVLAPRTMKVPPEAKEDTRFRNVFTCSMADLFGRWVPKEWIEAVFREIRAAPQWNFLCLTKFPKRMAEFDIPANAWMGTTVDLQARVPAAEAAFAKVKAGVRWLSIEPMLEPLKFKHLDRFNWVVIGGASRSSKTPEWHPPFAWIMDLVKQAEDAGCKVYFKTNLLGKRLLELPFDAPIPDENAGPPSEFAYLGKENGAATSMEQRPEAAA